jgi:ubiquinone/menaquinone biosynthesis C-methylase UbiE
MTTENTKGPSARESTRRRTKPPRGAKVPGKYLFTGARARLFKDALTEYPNARRDCLGLMRRHLEPSAGEHVLGFGEGSGFFCRAIAEAVGATGKYVITEPSPELFCHIAQDVLDLPHVFTEITAVEDIDVPKGSFDKAWACGAFHHCANQTEAIARIFRALKPGGRMVIFDIFAGTPLARHFDTCVARYCETGHEVKFLSDEFARTLCFLAGFDEAKVEIVNIPHRLCFASEWDMGNFILKMHAMTRLTGTTEERIAKTITSLKEHLTVEREGDTWVLHFDQKGLIAVK